MESYLDIERDCNDFNHSFIAVQFSTFSSWALLLYVVDLKVANNSSCMSYRRTEGIYYRQVT